MFLRREHRVTEVIASEGREWMLSVTKERLRTFARSGKRRYMSCIAGLPLL